VLWEALALRPLFEGETEGILIANVLEQPVVPPSRFAPGLPSALDDLTLRGLSRDPDRRFSSAREMAIALEGCTAAMPSVVGEWIQRVAGATLGQRAARIAEIESSADVQAPSSRIRAAAPEAHDVPTRQDGPPAGVPAVNAAAEAASPSVPAPVSVRSKTRWFSANMLRAGLAVVAAVLLSGVFVLAAQRHWASTTAVPPPVVVAPVPALSSAPRDTGSAVVSDAPVAPPASAPSPGLTPPARPLPRKRGMGDDCKYLDGKGYWRIRPQCL
jgi:serine/threonine-protein kinase